MIIAKAYEMLLAVHGGKEPGASGVGSVQHGAHEAWLSAGIYRAVSLTADLIDRIGRRTTSRG